MSTPEQRVAANRANALLSTGPSSAEGKAVASRNATRHGLLSRKLLLDDEEPEEFQALAADLCQSLCPIGMAEAVLVERIAVTIWRQKRLVHAEAASLALARQPKKIAGGVSSELGRSYGAELKQDELMPFDPDQVSWCCAVMSEIDGLDEIDTRSLEQCAPRIFQQLTSDAEEDGEDITTYVSGRKDGLTGYVAELLQWCREQIRHAEARPHILELAEQVRAKRLFLPTDAIDVLARYQTTLDNQMFKLLRALREAQEWRLKTLEQTPAQTADDIEEIASTA